MINVASISVPRRWPLARPFPYRANRAHIAGNCTSPDDKGLEIVSCYYGTGKKFRAPGYESGSGIGIALMNDKGQRITGAGGVTVFHSTPLGYVSDDEQRRSL
jgi:hypothetical protein